MDSNGTRFLLLAGAADFHQRSRQCVWDAEAGALTLAPAGEPRLPRLPVDEALALWRGATPYVLDDHGQIARLSADRRRVEFALGWPTTVWDVVRAARVPGDPAAGDLAGATLDAVDAPPGCTFTDLHLGGSGLLAAPFTDGGSVHGVLAVHLRHRWQARCPTPIGAVRAWVDAADQVWLLAATDLMLCTGAPLLQPYTPRADRFEPLVVEPDPLRCVWQQTLPGQRGVLALAADDESLFILALAVEGNDAAPRQVVFARPLAPSATAAFSQHALPEELPLAVDLAALGGQRVILLPPLENGAARTLRRDCPVVSLATPTARLLPERWPRRSEAGVRFVRQRDNLVRQLADDGVHRLYRLAQARYRPSGRALLGEHPALDSGTPGVLWDRVYLEASIPPGCTIDVGARAADDWDALADDADDLYEAQPAPLWSPLASELPFATGRAAPLAGRSGLFEVLLQRPNGAVREVRGRYLRLVLRLSGDGRHSPAIYALRVAYPRFSWQTHYLPDHFQQQEAPSARLPAEAVPANGADLRERLLACFYGVLTPLEDRIAAAETLLYPHAAPRAWLPRLAEMLGTRLRPHWSEERQRRWLSALGRLQAHKGSFAGLCQALDLITDGAVGRGQVVPVELFRLRRTLATVLGVSFDDARHPLTLGTGQSGNSIVGETLILSADQATEVLALFAPGLAPEGNEREQVEHFFDEYARRMTVVLHGPARALQTVVEEVLPELVPAIVQWNVVASEHPFVLGLSPLLRIDTYLETQPPPARVRLDESRLGRGDLLQNTVALSPENARPMAPIDPRGDWA
ncbi:phage tail protein [Accumulibacter sp.]|uniref:phage tail protein n=1 Tax=Accumulibacter sp. TaxID=2053492 RepID=UPI002604D59B|nr:phage tail protein [Accumulibacter sp.]